MATFPSYVKLQISGYTETASNLVERTEMERGVAKTRRVSTDPIMQVAVTMTFLSAQALADFRAWFYSPTGGAAGAGWFDWRDPRTNTIRQARFVSSSMGPIQYQRGDLRLAQRAAVLEYVDVIV